MSPYSMLLLTNQAIHTGQTQVLNQQQDHKDVSKEKKCRKNIFTVKKQYKSLVAASAPSFFSMGPEEEVFDIEIEDGLLASSVFHTPESNPSVSARGSRTPGARRSKTTPRAPKRRSSSSTANFREWRRTYKCEEVMEYAVDTYLWKRQLEERYKPGEVAKQSDVTGEKRQRLLEWLAAISRELHMSLETWCLSVNYLDRFFAIQPIAEECLQLSGLACLWIASKLEEQDQPKIADLIDLCESELEAEYFCNIEALILTQLEYNLQAPTPSFLLAHLVQIRGEKDWPKDLSRHMIEMCLCDPETSMFYPSEIAHSIYTIIKGSDPDCIREVVEYCPVCKPVPGDDFSRQFFAQCFHEISLHIRKCAKEIV